MKFSLILTTRRGIDALKPLFLVSDKDTEIIIVDTNYNEKTKQQLSELKHDYYQIVYAPPMTVQKYTVGEMTEIVFKRDLVRCHNTGFACAENPWIIKIDDSTEFHPDFFKNVKEDVEDLAKLQFNTKFVIRPIKLEEWSNHKQWEQHPILRQKGIPVDARYIDLDRQGVGDNMFVTLDQAVFPRDGIDALNGNDERYDIGHGFEDMDLMQRFITLGYKIILDQQLMTYQYKHDVKADPFSFSRVLYEFNYIEIVNGRYRAYNNYDLKELRLQLLEQKKRYIV